MTCIFKGFLSARQLNPNTPVKIIGEDLEPTEFKQYFTEWEGVGGYGTTQTSQAGVGIATKGTVNEMM